MTLTAKMSQADAAARVPSYVDPSDCFIMFMNNKLGYRVLEGTPCAHYVAHKLGITGVRGRCCNANMEIRVRELIKAFKEIAVNDVKVDDVWAVLKGTHKGDPPDHCGIVCDVQRGSGDNPQITIRHNSSGQKKVAENDWETYFKGKGKFYRLSRAVSPPAAQLGAVRRKYDLPWA